MEQKLTHQSNMGFYPRPEIHNRNRWIRVCLYQMNTKQRMFIIGLATMVIGILVIINNLTFIKPTVRMAPGVQSDRRTGHGLISDDPFPRGIMRNPIFPLQKLPDYGVTQSLSQNVIPKQVPGHRLSAIRLRISDIPKNVRISAPPKCQERKRVAFVKVHKAASTTITSVLQRFGYTRNLTFALPRRDFFHIGMYETFDPKHVLPIARGAVYEILCQHVVFNREAFKRYFPPDINIIASVREPTEMFVSTFMSLPDYTQAVQRKVNSTDPLKLMKEYLEDPGSYEPFPNGSLALNRMSFDLGIPKSHYRNCSYVTDYIKMLDDSMTFVLVAERFDESLVILKRKMCWSTKDILYKSQHIRPKRNFRIPLDVRRTMQILAPSDFRIYEYFSEKLRQIIATEIKLAEEVYFFRKKVYTIGKFCDNIIRTPNLTMSFGASEFSEAFTFNKADCLSLTMPEKDFVKRLIMKQVPKSKHQLFLGWSN